jgi:parallel beta-helix repeat protein
MSRKIFVRFGIFCVIASLVLSMLPVVPFAVRSTNAQPRVQATEGYWELYYDDGVTAGKAGTACPSCSRYAAVLFSLPQGLPSATLTKVRFYAGGGAFAFKVYLFDTALNELTAPVTMNVSKNNWYDVPLPDTTVPSQFWIMVRGSDDQVAVFWDVSRSGASTLGNTPEDALSGVWQPQGDLMIRAVIRPEVYVGSCPQATFDNIQEAVDAVGAGTTIVVCEGTYNENVTVNKSLTIKSLSGPTKTTVQTPYDDKDVFSITAPGVTLSGFTIQGATGAGGAGVRIEDVSDCLVSGNVILDNSYGIYLSQDSTKNILLENECKFNTNGVYVDGSQNYVSGNKLHGNTAQMGSAVFLSSMASGNQLRFNSITVDPGVAPGPQVYNQNSMEQASATENWWGSETGTANGGGTGSGVGEMVLYDPWLNQPPLRVKTMATTAGDYTVNARGETSTTVLKSGDGAPVVSVASFADNPAGEFPTTPIGKWVDVLFSSTDGVGQASIVLHYTMDQIAGLKEGSLRLYWWNGQEWKVCSTSKVDKVNDFVWAQVNIVSKPGLNDLGGTLFAVGTAGSGGFAWWLIPLVIVLLLLLLVVFRLFWVLVVQRGRYSID